MGSGDLPHQGACSIESSISRVSRGILTGASHAKSMRRDAGVGGCHKSFFPKVYLVLIAQNGHESSYIFQQCPEYQIFTVIFGQKSKLLSRFCLNRIDQKSWIFAKKSSSKFSLFCELLKFEFSIVTSSVNNFLSGVSLTTENRKIEGLVIFEENKLIQWNWVFYTFLIEESIFRIHFSKTLSEVHGRDVTNKVLLVNFLKNQDNCTELGEILAYFVTSQI